ncbi:MAG TPA: hypothetical protein VN455_05515, partial [Methanotrichaceae archaeon]|nr:hypothetical protein [Methanotrichaceae archaeon]
LLFGWDTFKRNLRLIVGIVIIAVVTDLFLTGLASSLTEESPLALRTGISIIYWIVSALIEVGLVKISLDFCDGQRPSPRELFSESSFLLRYILSTALYIAMIAVGLIFLIVPGIYLAIRCQFYSYLIVDKGLGTIESLKKSAEITRGASWNLALFGLMLVGINILGMLALGVGLLATLPISWLAAAFVYRRLADPVMSRGTTPMSKCPGIDRA